MPQARTLIIWHYTKTAEKYKMGALSIHYHGVWPTEHIKPYSERTLAKFSVIPTRMLLASLTSRNEAIHFNKVTKTNYL